MGRQMGKAKEVANRMMQMAQNINASMGLNLSSGLAQMGAFARFGMMMKVDQNGRKIDSNANERRMGFHPSTSLNSAFEPANADDINFVDYSYV